VPEFFFASLLCANVNYIVPKHVYCRQRSRHQPGQQCAIGTGPWKFKEWVRGSHFEYVRNDAYWRKDQPYLDRLIIRYVRDPAGRAAAMEAGDIHIGVFNPVAPPDIKAAHRDGPSSSPRPRATRKRCGRPRSNATCAIRSSPRREVRRRCSSPSTAT
jgi:peptide/nickel transport system substrate-binding protein